MEIGKKFGEDAGNNRKKTHQNGLDAREKFW